MAISEARSSYVLEDHASSAMRDIRLEAGRTTSALRETGGELDKIGSASQLQRLERLERRFGDVGRGAERMYGRVSTSTSRMEGAIRRDTETAGAHLDRLESKLEDLAMRTARPRVELDGYADTRLQIMSLQHQLDQLGRTTARARVGAMGGGPGAAFAGRPSGRSGAFVGSGGAGVFSSRGGLLVGGALAALPAVQGLGGAALGLSGSLAGAGLGLGATYIAGGGALAAGIGSVAAIAIPAKKNLDALTKAQEAHRQAVLRYQDTISRPGVTSAQVDAAQRRLAFEDAAYNRVRRQAPAGAEAFITERKALSTAWRSATRPGQAALLGLGTDVFSDLRRASPELGSDANMVARSTRRAGGALSDYLTSPEGLMIVRDLSHTFASNLDEAEHVAENLIGTFGNIARASSPFFHEGMDFAVKFTGEWKQSTSNIEESRRTIGGYIDDLRTWGRLGGAAFDLVRDFIMPGRHAGRSLADDLTGQLEEWDRWAKENPQKLDRFFSQSVESTKSLAGLVGTISHDLHEVADILGPIFNRFAALAQLADGAGLLLPTLLRFGLGRALGRGRGGGAGGAAAGIGGAPVIVGGGGGAGGGGAMTGALAASAGATYLAARTPYGAGRTLTTPERFAQRYGAMPEARYGMPVSQLGEQARYLGRVPGFAQTVGSKLAGAARFAAPIIIVSGAMQSATEDSSASFSDRFQGFLSGASLGLVPMPTTPQQSSDKGVQQAQTFLQGMPQARSLSGFRRQLGRISGEYNRIAPRSTTSPSGLFGGHGTLGIFDAGRGDDSGPSDDEARRNTSAMKEYSKALRQTVREMHGYRMELRATHDQESRTRGFRFAAGFQEGFGILAKHDGPESAMKQTLDDVFTKMRGMRPAGAKILGDSMLAWGREMAKQNPKLKGAVDELADRIEHRFSRMGYQVEVVNGKILTGSRSEWKSISEAITDPAELARQKVTDAFTAIQQQAVGSLQAMGMSPQQARSYISGLENQRTGKNTPASAMHAGDPGAASGASGDGIGDGPGSADAQDARARATAGIGNSAATSSPTSGSLMGAKPALGGYASIASRFGLHVTSGLRPGAITSSGNVSLHASGDAIDVSDGYATPQELRFARYMAENYGSGLDELIHTPLGYGIKNGRRVPLSFWGSTINAEHYNHVHVGDRTPSGRVTGGIAGNIAGMGAHARSVRLRAPHSGLAGYPGLISDTASALYAAALQHKINKSLGAGAFGAGNLGRMTGGVMTFQQVAALAESVGLPGITFAQIAKGESGFNPRALGNDAAAGYGNTWGLGLWQITTGVGNDKLIASLGGRDAMFNPMVNARAAKILYDEAGLSPWRGTRYLTAPNAHYSGDGLGHSIGNAVPWFGKGGDITATRPTVIGVGDHPRGEDVSIRPRRLGPPRHGRSGVAAGAGISVTIERMHVEYNRKGDLKRVVRDELREALEELRDELDYGIHDEDAVLA